MSQDNAKQAQPVGRMRWLLPRLTLSIAALLVALLVVELALRLAGLPRSYRAHEQTMRFAFVDVGPVESPFYINHPGRITFTYDGNPRGYFNERNEVHHDVNPSGFRGPAFRPKEPGERHLIFLGDSFTFGEGVRNEDVFPEVTARILRGETGRVEAYNLGVGGYNTSQSLEMLKRAGLAMQPDVVVLGYTINDAEPALFEYNSITKGHYRRARESDIEAEGVPKEIPTTGWCRLRLGQWVWQVKRQRALSRQTIDYYLRENEPSRQQSMESENALREIIALCREQQIPCVVVMFPLLFELSDDHPFQSVHERIGRVVGESGGEFIDLLPELKGRRPAELIVHPTDQHPNEMVHELAGRLLAEKIQGLGISVD